ncbi:MAG: DUF1573 domain-containing protein [Patescibacteria group bacterium]|nr:DUF1573 domain-containing protein [Patescibacteria group bacterium]
MQNLNSQSKIKNTSNQLINPWKIFSLILSIILAGSLILNAFFIQRNSHKNSNLSASLIENVSAEEIYPIFECPCCGKPIDQCTCPMAKERMTFIDALAGVNISEHDIMMAYVKKYGLNYFVDKERQEEFKQYLIEQASEERPIISLSSDVYDFGDVSQKDGKVFAYFEIKNNGQNDLIIDRLSTSCGCTFASIIFEGAEGPGFTMSGHGYENPTNWKVVIPKNQTAQLKVSYDPDMHKDFRGPAIRTISIFSNDPIDFEKSVKIELDQVD